jgi:DeoR/GlpR family transcriptional regulator of sugar metabolism
MTRKCAEVFISDKFFIGADGFSHKFVYTGKDHMRAQTVQDLAEHARNVIVLTESEKFLQQGVLGLVRTEKVAAVYTDDHIPQETEELLLEKKVLVNKVPQHLD